MAPALLIRDATPSNHAGRDICIALACVGGATLLAVLIVHYRKKGSAATPLSDAERQRKVVHLNPAEVMRLSALREQARPKRKGFSDFEMDIVAPLVMYSQTHLEKKNGHSTATASLPQCPKPVILANESEKAKPSEIVVRVLPLDEDDADSIPAAGKPLPPTSGLGDNASICSVCLEGFQPRQVVRETVCHHAFHCGCLEQWLRKKGRCPLCQEDLRQTLEELHRR